MATIGFIGGGRVTRIMLRGWRRAAALPDKVLVSDTEPSVLDGLRRDYGVEVADSNSSTVAASDVLFLALHPPQLQPALAGLAMGLRPTTVVVSLAPRRTLAQLEADLAGHPHIARLLPNAASIIGDGYNPIAFGPGLCAEGRSELMSLLQPLGDAPEVPETALEAYALIAAMGPTYLWFQLEHLERLGEEFGLEREAARRAVFAMARGAVRTLFDSGLPSESVLDLIPVRPLSADEDAIRALYDDRLRALHQRLRAEPPVPAGSGTEA
jgi:pyrroline-5-carboxylate reductase